MENNNLWSGLSTQTQPVSRYSRLHYLRELEEHLTNFYIPYTEVVGKGYSIKEQEIIVRVIKLLIRQLFGTPKYHLFSRKGQRCNPGSQKEEEEEELRNQKTDEIRLKQIKLSKYNPLSEKYKALKRDFLRKLQK